MEMSTLAVVGGLMAVGVVGYVISIYNSLVQVRNNVDKAWKNIDVLLQQRHEELNKLVDTCKGYLTHEREVLESLTKLRAGYDQATTTDEKVAVENQLNKVIERARLTFEAYPDLKASENFLQLQRRISGVESSIADRREFLNDSVNIYNIQIERFPEVILANAFHYRRKPFLEVPEATKGDNKINFA
jgi:LemA protein